MTPDAGRVPKQKQAPRPLPPGWRWVRLGEICSINPPRCRDLKRASDALTTFVPMEAVSDETGLIVHPQVRAYQEVARGYTYFEEGDIIWAKITPCMENGKSAIARDLLDGMGFGSTEFHVIRPGVGILPEFVWHFVRQPRFRLEATRHFVGAVGQQRVPDVFLRDAYLPLPPLDEQRAIVTRLEAQMAEVQRLRAAAERQLAAARSMQGAILRQVFRYKEGDALPTGWRWARLGEVCKVDRRQADMSNPAIAKLPFLGMENVESHSGRILTDVLSTEAGSSSLVYGPEHVLYGKLRPYLNKVVIPETVGRCSLEFVLLRPIDNIDRHFLGWMLRSPAVVTFAVQVSTGERQPRADMKRLLEFGIPLPPPDEQRAIVARLDAQMAEVQRLRAAAERQLEAIRALPGALLNEVFGGFESQKE